LSFSGDFLEIFNRQKVTAFARGMIRNRRPYGRK
jgi:hypothetical protein